MTKISMRLLLVLAMIVVLAAPALAQKNKKGGQNQAKKKGGATPVVVDAGDGGAKRKKKERVFEFGAFGIEGSMRTPQLIYFLGRVKEELDRASLEKRSFMPELERSVEEGGL